MKKIEILNKIINKYKFEENQKITLYELKNISKNENIHISDLIFILGCNRKILYKKDESWTRINYNMKHSYREQIKLIKIDLKYLKKYGDRMYTKLEIIKICKKYGVSLDNFLTYIYNYKICYYENMYILEDNKEGMWIGDRIFLSQSFINNFFKEIDDKVKKLVEKMSSRYQCKELKDLLIDVAYNKLIQLGQIEKNLKFDNERLISKLLYKARYAILDKIIEEKRVIYDDTIIQEHLDNNNSEFEINDKIDCWLYPINFTIMQKIIIDEIQVLSNYLTDRNKIMNFISKRYLIDKEKLYIRIEEIRNLLIQFNKVKICKDGRIIILNE